MFWPNPPDEFLNDSKADPRAAEEKLVDRLLSSPAYGKRWGRLWLDVVRFAESHGYEMNTLRPNAWPYRDYIIRAFNRDTPFPQFILEQLDCDTVSDCDMLTQTATGFLVEVEGAGDVKVADINVPMFARLGWLVAASAFLRDLGRAAGEQMVGFKDVVDAGGTAGDDISVEHHERQSSVPFEGVLAGKDADPFFLVVGQPMVARPPGVVFVHLAEAINPVVVFAGGDARPREEAKDGNLCLVAPETNEVDELIAGIVRHPASH